MRRRKLKIEVCEGELKALRSKPTFRETRVRSDAVDPEGGQLVSMDEFLAEEHHRYYGRPWVMGRFYVDHLRARGLVPTDRVLDFGCGAGRVGIWLIPFLQRGRYFGVDAHLRSLAAFAMYEAVLHGLAGKAPRLLLDGDFRFDHFGERFDVMLDFSVSFGLRPEQMSRAYVKARDVLQPGARVFMPHRPKLPIEDMERLGFVLDRVDTVAYPLLPEAEKPVASIDQWHEFVRV